MTYSTKEESRKEAARAGTIAAAMMIDLEIWTMVNNDYRIYVLVSVRRVK